MTSKSNPIQAFGANRLIAGVVEVSAPGATLKVSRIELTPEGRRGLTVGGGVLPNGDIALAIPREARPFCDEPAVLNYYDGPLLMVLSSPLWGDMLAMALPDEEGPWPFLLAPVSPEQLDSIKVHLREYAGEQLMNGRGVRDHFTAASTVFLLRDYGAQDLAATPLDQPLPDEWLPAQGY